MSFNPIDSIIDFLEPIDKYALSSDEGYKPNHLGNSIEVYETEFPSLENIDLVIIGCSENRGEIFNQILIPQMQYAKSCIFYIIGTKTFASQMLAT